MIQFPEVSVGPIGAALVAAFVAFVSLIVSKDQKVSEFRQAWIDSLRNELAQVVTHALAIVDGPAEAEMRENLLKINQAIASIRLRLNPKEQSAAAILDDLELLEKLLTQKPIENLSELDRLERDILCKAQLLLKSEWMRVRRGEFSYKFTKWGAAAVLILGAVIWLGHPFAVSNVERGDVSRSHSAGHTEQ